MSALAHALEDRGIPSVAIGLVRVQMEKTQPPRGLFVPFQLGRPLGEPGDAAFQLRVILQALGLLERTDGPVILEDFPDDPPGWFDTQGWAPPSLPSLPRPRDSAGWRQAFATELAALRPAWERAQARYGRTSIGLSFTPPDTWPDLAAAFLAGGLPVVDGHATPALTMRFLSDDIKAMYGEAGQADGVPPATRQLDAWFWRQTLAGQLLIALRSVAMASENNGMKTVAPRFLVPVPWLPPAA